MTPQEHYDRAEALLDEGVKVVEQIANVPNEPLPDHVMQYGEDE